MINHKGIWGLIEKKEGVIVSRELSPTATAVYTKKETPLFEKPEEGAQKLPKTLPENTSYWLDYKLGAFYLVFLEGEITFAHEKNFKVVGSNELLQAREVYVEKEQDLLDFPLGDYGKKIGALAGNQSVTVLYENSDYYYVQFEEQKGFILKNQTWEMDEVVTGKNYYLLVNKGDFSITVYEADENHEKTQEVARTITTALGKRTTPTPTGEFLLEGKEDWHYFGLSYAPFAIKYAPGKYLHGPLYASRNIGSLKVGSLASFGTNATGGCLRMPYEDILWLYFHVVDGQTPMEVVNGMDEDV